MAQRGSVSGAQFASQATAAAATVCLGFVPDVVVYIQATAATNPNVYLWFDAVKFGVADADSDNDDVFLITGSTGIVTKTEGIKPHLGDTEVLAATDEDTYLPDGTNLTVGDRTSAGLEIAAAIQTNSGHNVLLAWQADGMINPVVA